MHTTIVPLPGREYSIHIGKGLLALAGQHIAPLAKGRLALLTDETVWQLYGKACTAALQQAGLAVRPLVLPPGEESKSLPCLGLAYNAFAQAGLGRDGLALAFGGGVVGDLTGFAAATYMRGISWVQLPTTLLAQVDSSVGGKTAINLPAGKNLAGAFHQPRLVLADTALLATLPEAEFSSGMAEVVKYSAIQDAILFEQLATPPKPEALPALIQRCCAIKSGFVCTDEHDTGQRMLLNFGHSFGHAVEALGAYRQHSHGQAVAIGMVLAAQVGELLGITAGGTAGLLRQTLAAQGLPTTCPYSAKQMLLHMQLDKKNTASAIRLVLLRQIGDAVIENITAHKLGGLLKEALPDG